jgi:hypothetical protein
LLLAGEYMMDVRARSKIIFPFNETASLARFAGIPNTHALFISRLHEELIQLTD